MYFLGFEVDKERENNMDTNQLKFLMYRSADGDVSVNAIIKDETIWLTQKAMAELFGVDKSSISRHLKNIFVEGELDENVVVAEIATTTQHGAIRGKTQSRETKFYNLDAIISVGYRVNSRRATQFRIWAAGILKEYIIKGFAMDDERLKQARTIFGKDYFRELLERVRSIRASERRIWQQITDIFAECMVMKLTVLMDNNTYIDQYYLGEPAFSVYIEDGAEKILFDTGYSDAFLRNAEQMQVDMNALTYIVLSHGHNDHSRGLTFLWDKYDLKNVKLVAHPEDSTC